MSLDLTMCSGGAPISKDLLSCQRVCLCSKLPHHVGEYVAPKSLGMEVRHEELTAHVLPAS